MKPFTNTQAYKTEDVYNIITDEFHNLKNLGIIESWVEIDDIYLDTDGDVYAVHHYVDTCFTVEGHGVHTITDSTPIMKTAVLILTHTQVLAQMYPELFNRILTVN